MNLQVVDTAREIMKEMNNCISKNHASIYYQFDTKKVRFSDHLPKMVNLCQNEGVDELMFVFEGLELSVYEIDVFENQIYSEFPNLQNLQIHIIENEEDKVYVQQMIQRFIKK